MNCAQCEAEITEGAQFCSQCGTAINGASAKAVKPRVIWSVLLGVALVGAYAAMFIPAFVGLHIDPMSGYGSMFWSSMFFLALWKYRLRTGWHGALIGAGVGLLMFTLAAFVSGYIRASSGI